MSTTITATALSSSGIVDTIIGFVGRGHYLYLGSVSKAFSKAYSPVHGEGIQRLTLLTAIFQSPSHVRQAFEHGFSQEREDLPWYGMFVQSCAGRLAPDCETLHAAHECGVPYSAQLTRGAAESGSLAKLQFLYQQPSCEWPDDIAESTARSGDLSLVQWLLQLSRSDEKVICGAAASTAAAKAGHLHILQFLISEGVPCHGHLCAIAADRADLQMLQVCWVTPIVQLLLVNAYSNFTTVPR
jgi:hypothetical protein